VNVTAIIHVPPLSKSQPVVDTDGAGIIGYVSVDAPPTEIYFTFVQCEMCGAMLFGPDAEYE
jgi:hypothetical protein